MKLKLVRTGPGARTHYAWTGASRFICGTRFSWSAIDIREHDNSGTNDATCKNCRTVRAAHLDSGKVTLTVSPRRFGGYEMFCQGIHLGWVTEKYDGHRAIMRASEWGNGETMGYCDTVAEATAQMRRAVLAFMFPDTRKATA